MRVGLPAGAGAPDYGDRGFGCQGGPLGGRRATAARPARESAATRLHPRLRSRRAAARVRSHFSQAADLAMRAVIELILLLLNIYWWLLVAQAILSWLLAFGVINRYNRGVAIFGDFLYRVTEPLLRPIRSVLPNFGGIDISPVILMIIIWFIEKLIVDDVAPALLRY
jgi:YggT family protein